MKVTGLRSAIEHQRVDCLFPGFAFCLKFFLAIKKLLLDKKMRMNSQVEREKVETCVSLTEESEIYYWIHGVSFQTYSRHIHFLFHPSNEQFKQGIFSRSIVGKEHEWNLLLANRLLQLLFRPQVVGVSTLSFPTIGGLLMETSITLSANHLVTVILLSQDSEGWFNNTTSKSKDQVESWLYNRKQCKCKQWPI